MSILSIQFNERCFKSCFIKGISWFVLDSSLNISYRYEGQWHDDKQVSQIVYLLSELKEIVYHHKSYIRIGYLGLRNSRFIISAGFYKSLQVEHHKSSCQNSKSQKYNYRRLQINCCDGYLLSIFTVYQILLMASFEIAFEWYQNHSSSISAIGGDDVIFMSLYWKMKWYFPDMIKPLTDIQLWKIWYNDSIYHVCTWIRQHDSRYPRHGPCHSATGPRKYPHLHAWI